MPCTKCNKSVITEKKNNCRLRYCLCGECNHCHLGGICSDNKGWYQQALKKSDPRYKPRERFDKSQSHGGHEYIPGCNNTHKH